MIDSHAHYDDARFDDDRDSLLRELFEKQNIEAIVDCASDIGSARKILGLSEKYGGLYAAVGIHPQEAAEVPEDYIEILTELLKSKKAVAIGEIGLDYHYELPEREVQKRVFNEQLKLAERLCVPVVIHDRDAHKDCIDSVFGYNIKGVFHSFSGSAETAILLQRAGWYISFSGVVTFKNAKKTVEAALAVEDDRLLVETDCPYLTPHPFRGERNNSGLMRYTIEKLAEIRSQSFEYVEHITSENAKRLFGISSFT